MQLSLQLDAPAPSDTPSDVQRLITWLAARPGWTTARHIRDALGIDERATRRLASDSAGLIISGPGCPGYKYIGACTPGEIRETVQRLDHQAAVMLTRAREIRRQAHALLA